jgi:hypothetical protein
MNWMIVVLFATLQGDVYLFTEPTFETREQCIEYISDKEQIPSIVEKLVWEYGRQMPIHAINCLEEDVIKNILNGVDEA